MIDAKAVGLLLGLSLSKVYELARTGALVSYRFGDAVRFEPTYIEAYKQSCRLVVRQAASRGKLSPAIRLAASDPREAGERLRAFAREVLARHTAPVKSAVRIGKPRKAAPCSSGLRLSKTNK